MQVFTILQWVSFPFSSGKMEAAFLSQKQCFPTTDFVVCALIPKSSKTHSCATLTFTIWLFMCSCTSLSLRYAFLFYITFFYQLSTLPIVFQTHLFPLRIAYWRYRILNDDLWFLYKTLTTNLLWSHCADLCSILNPSQYLFSSLTETFPLSSYHPCKFYSICYGT